MDATQHPVHAQLGIPQGDAAAPTVLGMLLSLGHSRSANTIPAYQHIYVDDQAIIGRTHEQVEQANSTRADFSHKHHLVENDSKLQRATTFQQLAGWDDSGEVLGIGCPEVSVRNLHMNPKLSGAQKLAKRVRYLPQTNQQPFTTMGLFARPKGLCG